MAEAQDETMLLDELIDRRRGVCHIKAAGGYQGTGFYFGNGWVMFVAHNFQAGNDPVDFHSLLSSAEFIFEMSGEEKKRRERDNELTERRFVTAGNYRMAFVHHLQTPDGRVDRRNKDIAMVKLGVQYEYGRPESEYEEWEKQEQEWLDEMELPPFASLNNNTLQINDRVYSIHYGNGSPIKFSRHTVTRVNKTSGGIPIIKFNPTFPPGSSGCPILDMQYRLVGLLFGGGQYGNPKAVDFALQFRDGILPFAHDAGPRIISEAGAYFTQPTNNAQHMHELENIAATNTLTIYLSNGDVINGEPEQPEQNVHDDACCCSKCVVL